MTLFAVLDPDQMMFRFQGAKPELMMSGIDEYIPDIQTILLDRNHRSTENIIFSSQQLISYNYSAMNGPYQQEFMKDVSGVRGDGEAISFQMYPTIEAEALAIAETIQEMIKPCEHCNSGTLLEQVGSDAGDVEQANCGYCFGRGSQYVSSDFFIGARTRAQLGYLEGPLVRKGIKFINLCGGSFWQSKHVADVVAYLRLAYNTSDSTALQRVYNIPSSQHKYTWNDKHGKFKAGDYCPTRYLGQEFLAKINNDFNKIDNVLLGRDAWRYKTNDRDYYDYGPSKAQDLQEFIWSLQGVLDYAEDMGQVIRIIIDDCYEKYLRVTEGFTGSDESENGKLEDLRTVEDIASEYQNPEDFLAFVNESVKAAEDAKNGDWNDYIVLSTYHRLKGLERKVVFGTGWCEGHARTKDGREEPRGLLPHTFSLIPPPQFGVLPSGKQSPIEDERCIAFVCVSRAKDRVFLSGCQQYREWQLFPSRFIREMGIEESNSK